jgi:hypothetical protein
LDQREIVAFRIARAEAMAYCQRGADITDADCSDIERRLRIAQQHLRTGVA